VNVNSLEQLININQTLTTDLGAPASSGSGSSSQTASALSSPTQAATPGNAGVMQAAHKTAASPIAPLAAPPSSPSHASGTAALRTPGNLGIPGVNPAAERVAHALDGRTRAQPAGENPATSQ